jgi:putative transposase
MYPSDITRKEWKLISPLFVCKSKRGRKSKHDKRKLLNGVLYVVKGGIQWRMMPKDFPPWKTVYTFFRRMCLQGVWEKVLDFVNKKYRVHVGKNEEPSFAIVDSQSVKTQYNSDNRGYDGGKKNKREKASHRS